MPFPGSVGGPSPASTSLAERFLVLASLSEAETELLQNLPDPCHHPSQRDLYAVGALLPPRLVVAGWACRYRLLADKRRQILGFVLPGDFVGRAPLPGLPSPYAVAALAELRTVSAQPLVEAAANPAYAGLARAVRLTAHLDDMMLFNQLVRLGQQTARERVAHLILELHERLSWMGLAWGGRFAMPLTPSTLADALGLSVVHVSRTLQQLRNDGLLDVRGGMAALLKPEQLTRLGRVDAPQLGAQVVIASGANGSAKCPSNS